MKHILHQIHFVGIGGAGMSGIAEVLLNLGYKVSGSDMAESATTKRLRECGAEITIGHHAKNVGSAEAVVISTAVTGDNPEVLAARAARIPIVPRAVMLGELMRLKQGIAIAGTHGKTTTTAMVMHVLKKLNINFDYLVGSQLEGFETMVKFSDAPIMIIEGDEYLTSPIDRTPKFFHYHHDIALVSGIAWDHFNVFPDFEEYKAQFSKLMDKTPIDGKLIYCEVDPLVKSAAEQSSTSGQKVPYKAHPARIQEGKTYLITSAGEVEIGVFGDHNLQNLQGALNICESLGVSPNQFYHSIQTFKGAAKRQEILAKGETGILFRDFAHAPSKLKATVNAVKNQFPERRLIAVQELHTYSSLNKAFLPNYANSMDEADVAVIYLNPHAVALKKLELMDEATLREGFKRKDLILFTESAALKDFLLFQDFSHTNLLLMSSGNYDNLDLEPLKAKFQTHEA